MNNRFARWVFAAFACGALALAQEFRGTVTGQVTDPTGAGVPNAKVTVQNLQTNETVWRNEINNRCRRYIVDPCFHHITNRF